MSWSSWSLTHRAVATWTELICDSTAARDMADAEVTPAERDCDQDSSGRFAERSLGSEVGILKRASMALHSRFFLSASLGE